MYRYAIVLVGFVGLALARNEVMTALFSQNLFAKTFGGTGGDHFRSIIQTTDGGLAVAGETHSFGAGSDDFLVLKFGPDGSYPYCDYLQDCNPTVMSVNPSTSTPTVGATCSPSTSSPSPTITTPTLTITDVCVPVELEERDLSGPWPRITCSPLPGAALFLSHGEVPIKIYSADGRLAYSGNLQKGENRINLETGVYLWNAGNYKIR